MIVPRHWAQARLQGKRPGKQITLYRFGWSNESAQAAQAMADERVRAAMARALAGEQLSQREPKVPYNGAEGVPIREEILSEHGEDVVTRNSYGARCLNTPDVLIADVDFAPRREGCLEGAAVLLVMLVAIVLWTVTGSLSIAVQLAFGAVVALLFLARLVRWLRLRIAGGAERLARSRIEGFIAKHPEWRLHSYRTPAGLRLIATHRCFSPTEPAVKELFDALHVDPLYVTMCTRQQCFRARLTAKPWRIGMESHLTPRPGVWPVNEDRLPARAKWIAAYEAKAAGFAACRWLETFGTGQGLPRAEALRVLHDELSRARSTLPLA